MQEKLSPENYSPMIDQQLKNKAINYGYSFNSKKVAMGPTYFNIRIICECLGRAIRKHIDFSQQIIEGQNHTFWFLDELFNAKKEAKQFKKNLMKKIQQRKNQKNNIIKKSNEINLEESTESAVSAATAFSYDFEQNLKIITEKKNIIKKDQDEDEFSRNSDIEDKEIEIQQQKSPNKAQFIEKSMQVVQNNNKNLEQNASTLKNQKESTNKNQNSEYFEKKIDDVNEQKLIEQLRREELLNKSHKISLEQQSIIQMQLLEKDKKIQELTKMVELYENEKNQSLIQEVLAFSDNQQIFTRADFLMAQLDLEPIESNYSLEQMQPSTNQKQNKNKLTIPYNHRQKITLQQNLEQDLGKTAQSQQQQQITQEKQQNTIDQLDSFKSVSQGISLNKSSGNTFIQEQCSQKSDPFHQSNLQMQLEGGSPQKNTNNKNQQQQQQYQEIQTDQKKKVKIPNAPSDISREEQLQILSENIRLFDERIVFDEEEFDPQIYIYDPCPEDIAAYCKYVTIACKMENEAPIIALVYIERILLKTGILVNKYNWKRILLICLCVASKVWDDDSLENIHFPKVMADVTIDMINRLEQILLDMFLSYDLVVKGSEYAKYYFIMRTLANELREESQTQEEKQNHSSRDQWASFPLQKPISSDQMLALQKNTAKAEIFLKERYEKEMILALGNKFKGKNQKIRERKFFNNQDVFCVDKDFIEGMLSTTI